jgi:hypothetical protein
MEAFRHAVRISEEVQTLRQNSSFTLYVSQCLLRASEFAAALQIVNRGPG